MKLLLLPLVLLLVATPVYGQLLSDKTGLVNRLDIESGGHNFEVEIVSNFDITNHEFNKNEKRLTIFLNSGLENNLGEISIPQLLLGGNFTFFLNDVEFYPKIKSSEKISFITVNFSGIGENKLDIIGTTLEGFVEETIDIPVPNLMPSEDYDYELIYAIVIVIILIVGGIVAAVFVAKRRKS